MINDLGFLKHDRKIYIAIALLIGACMFSQAIEAVKSMKPFKARIILIEKNKK